MSFQKYKNACKLFREDKDDEFINLFDTAQLSFDVTADHFMCTFDDTYTLFDVACLFKAYKCVKHMLKYVEKIHIDSLVAVYGKTTDKQMEHNILQKYLTQNNNKLPKTIVSECKSRTFSFIAYLAYQNCSLQLFEKAIQLFQVDDITCQFVWYNGRSLLYAILSTEEYSMNGVWRPDLAMYLIKNYRDEIQLNNSVVVSILENWSNNFCFSECRIASSNRQNEEEGKTSAELFQLFFVVCKEEIAKLELRKLFETACETMNRLNLPLDTLWHNRMSKKMAAKCSIDIAKMVFLFSKPIADFYNIKIPYQIEPYIVSCFSETMCSECGGTGQRSQINLQKVEMERQKYIANCSVV